MALCTTAAPGCPGQGWGPGQTGKRRKESQLEKPCWGRGAGAIPGFQHPLHSLAQQVILEHLLRARNCPQSQEDGDELGEVLALGAASPLQAR